jgi:hypothetical protein
MWNTVYMFFSVLCSMGPVLRTRVAQSSRTGDRPADSVDDRCKVLADKTNSHMAVEWGGRRRRRRGSLTIPQPNLSIQQKLCIYKVGSNVENQDLSPQEKLALYNFEVDENEPLPKKKSKYKRKVRHRKKMDLSDMSDDEYTLPVTAKKHLLSGRKSSVAKKKKQTRSLVTCQEKVTLKSKENVSVADISCKCQNSDVTHHYSDSHQDVGGERKENVSFACAYSGSSIDCVSRSRTATENMDIVADSTYTCQKTNVAHSESTDMTRNKEIASVAGRHLTVNRVSEICTSLTEGAELNCSVGESESSQFSSSCRRSLLLSPIEKCPLQPSSFMAVRWPERDSRGLQSVQDFNIDNCFGFDEESEDDLHLSLSPVKMASRLKPVLSGPFAVSSTPNRKPTLTKPEAMSKKLMQNIGQTRTPFVSVQSATPPEHLLASNVEPSSIAEAGYDHSPPVLFVDKSDSVTHFIKVSLTQDVMSFVCYFRVCKKKYSASTGVLVFRESRCFPL